MTFKGRFLADGAVGTLRARSQLRKARPSLLPVRQRDGPVERTPVRVALLAAVGVLLAAAPAAHADTVYGGATVPVQPARDGAAVAGAP